MGIFLIKNLVNHKTFLGYGANLPGIFNRFRFELKTRVHRNKKLQLDWNQFKEENFSFEIIDELKPNQPDPNFDYSKELEILYEIWREKLPNSEYNED